MIQKWSRYQVLQQFFDFPKKAFLIRELSRNTKLAATAIRIHLKALLKEGLIAKEVGGLYHSFKAQIDSPLYKTLKWQNLVLRLQQSGLLVSLEKSLYPTCVLLFGSASRGEDTEMSDIDIFVQAKLQKIDMNKFEKELNRKINILFESNLNILGPELLNNLSNGIVLYGYLKVL
ncbi:nucleotidyltransferase domain-containing protein [Candidatus Woesearchaeota archaeon]|nr:nucleotidyltransferase domain-containing protein [Candidatus Woesearchaeota archaeon]